MASGESLRIYWQRLAFATSRGMPLAASQLQIAVDSHQVGLIHKLGVASGERAGGLPRTFSRNF